MVSSSGPAAGDWGRAAQPSARLQSQPIPLPVVFREAQARDVTLREGLGCSPDGASSQSPSPGPPGWGWLLTVDTYCDGRTLIWLLFVCACFDAV